MKFETEFLKEIDDEQTKLHGKDVQLPGGYYCEEADCYFYYEEDVAHYAIRLDEWATMYISCDGGEERIIGAQIKGINELCDKGTLRAIIGTETNKQGVRIAFLLMFRLQISGSSGEERDKAYKKLTERFFNARIPAEEVFT